MIQKILVVGGTGMLGEPVARKLRADGYPVRGLTRSLDQARKKFNSDFELIAGEVEQLESLIAAMQGCQGVHINLDGRGD